MPDPEIRGIKNAAAERADGEREAVRALLRSEFEVAPGVGEAFARLYDSLLNADPEVTSDCSRVAAVEGRVIGHALLAPRPLRVCDGVCPGGLVGMVVVHPDFRNQGVASQLIDDVHRLAKEKAIGLLVLAGDPAFYRRFGYHHAFVTSTCVDRINSSKLPASTFRAASHSEIDTLAALSPENTPPGSVVRTSSRWTWILETRHPAGLLKANPVMLGENVIEDLCLLDPGEKGYVRIAMHGSVSTVYEAGVMSGSGEAMLQQVHSFCAAAGARELRLRLPEEHPIVEAACASPTTNVDGEFQFKITDLDVFLASAQKGFGERITRVLPEWSGCLSFQTETDLVEFSRVSGRGMWRRQPGTNREPGGEFRLSIPEWGIGRLLLGQDDVLKLLETDGMETIDGEALKAAVRSPKPMFTLTDAI